MRHLRSGAPVLGVALVLLVLGSCGGDSPTTPPAPVPGSLTIAAGDAQTGVVGAALGTALSAVVKDTHGAPLGGVAVSWSVTTGGGSVSQASTTSGNDGGASVTWTLGGAAGAQSVTATAAGFSVTYSATAEPGPAAQVVVTPGAATLEALEATVELAASAADQFGNAVAGAGDVTWASADTTVVSVGPDGTATAVANGAADVTATVGSLSGKATLTVAQKATGVAVTPDNPVTSIGGTVQLAASGLDANGFAVAGGTFTWTTSDPAVATVDTTGLVTAVAEGAVTITAAAGGVSGTAALTVTAAPFEPTEDTEISGDLSVAGVSVPVGVTVTLTNDAVITAAGKVTIAGTLSGDCVAATISAGGDLTVTGTVSNACSSAQDAPPDLILRSTTGTLSLDGATVRSAGAVVIGDGDGASGAAPQRAPSARGSGTFAAEGGVSCVIDGGDIEAGFEQKDGDVVRPSTPNVRVACGGGISLSGVTLVSGDGRPGESREGSGEVVGGNGGSGGDIALTTAGTLHFSAIEGPVRIFLGSGGTGGNATAEGVEPVARGGAGGDAGSLAVSSGTTQISPGALETYLGTGGDGGDAVGRGLDGLDADATHEAQPAGTAKARGGSGGDHSELPEEDNYDLLAARKGNPGYGGTATVIAGKGGDGSAEFPDGAKGGTADAGGGRSGDYLDGTEQLSPDVFADGGDVILEGGSGGNGYGGCSPLVAEGGSGGPGGDSYAYGGESFVGGADGGITFRGFGNGGSGGDAFSPGFGGDKGEEKAASGSSLTLEGQPSFQFGLDGEACPQSFTEDVGLVVADDPAGHEPFVRMAATVSRIFVELFGSASGVDGPQAAGGAGALTITGNGNWITVSGSVGEDGTFTLTGAGTAAGISNVSTSFAGTLTRDENGTITGVGGTLTVGTNGELFGTPVSYTVSKSGG